MVLVIDTKENDSALRNRDYPELLLAPLGDLDSALRNRDYTTHGRRPSW